MGWLVSAVQDITADVTGVAVTLPAFPDDQGTVLVVVSNTELAGGEAAYLVVDSDSAPNGLIIPAATQRQWEIYCNAGTTIKLATAAATAACKVNVGLGAGVTPISNDVSALSALNAIETKVGTVDTVVDATKVVVDTIAADVVETAAGRPQSHTYTNATLATDAADTVIFTCATQQVWLHRAYEQLAAAAHANTSSLQLVVCRGAVDRKTLINAVTGARGVFTGDGVGAPWEDEAILLDVNDTIEVRQPSGVAGGTNSYRCSITVTAAADGGTITVTP